VAGGFASSEAFDRHRYYPETLWPEGTYGYWVPTLWVDGRDERTSADADVIRQWGDYKNMISARRAISSPLVMDLTVSYGDRGDTAAVHVQVIAEDSLAFNDLHLRLAITESGLLYKGLYHQVLRDYVPDISGTYFTLAQGDTFTHIHDFIWDEMWIPANSRLVAFVQDDENGDVLQAVQTPMVAPQPEQPGGLSATLAGAELRLDWSAVTSDTSGIPIAVDHYQVYRDTAALFDPADDPLHATTELFFSDDSGAVGDPTRQFFYWVTAVAGTKESDPSGPLGEFDRALTAGK
jgi:hypothetical protein